MSVGRSVPRKPYLAGGAEGHNMKELPCRKAPPVRAESFAYKLLADPRKLFNLTLKIKNLKFKKRKDLHIKKETNQ